MEVNIVDATKNIDACLPIYNGLQHLQSWQWDFPDTIYCGTKQMDPTKHIRVGTLTECKNQGMGIQLMITKNETLKASQFYIHPTLPVDIKHVIQLLLIGSTLSVNDARVYYVLAVCNLFYVENRFRTVSTKDVNYTIKYISKLCYSMANRSFFGIHVYVFTVRILYHIRRENYRVFNSVDEMQHFYLGGKCSLRDTGTYTPDVIYRNSENSVVTINYKNVHYFVYCMIKKRLGKRRIRFTQTEIGGLVALQNNNNNNNNNSQIYSDIKEKQWLLSFDFITQPHPHHGSIINTDDGNDDDDGNDGNDNDGNDDDGNDDDDNDDYRTNILPSLQPTASTSGKRHTTQKQTGANVLPSLQPTASTSAIRHTTQNISTFASEQREDNMFTDNDRKGKRVRSSSRSDSEEEEQRLIDTDNARRLIYRTYNSSSSMVKLLRPTKVAKSRWPIKKQTPLSPFCYYFTLTCIAQNDGETLKEMKDNIDLIVDCGLNTGLTLEALYSYKKGEDDVFHTLDQRIEMSYDYPNVYIVLNNVYSTEMKEKIYELLFTYPSLNVVSLDVNYNASNEYYRFYQDGMSLALLHTFVHNMNMQRVIEQGYCILRDDFNVRFVNVNRIFTLLYKGIEMGINKRVRKKNIQAYGKVFGGKKRSRR